MQICARVPYASIELHWAADLPGPASMRARQLRGALAEAFRDDDLFQHHDDQGRPLRPYPRVHCRWGLGSGVVAGWHDAAEKLLNVPWLDLSLRLGGVDARVAETKVSTDGGVFGWADQPQHYRFESPVILFDAENYQRYRNVPPVLQRNERDRSLAAQTLTALRELGVCLEGRLRVSFARSRPRTCRYKGQEVLGLTGRIVTNALLPDGFAVGHAVGRGYGWLRPRAGKSEEGG